MRMTRRGVMALAPGAAALAALGSRARASARDALDAFAGGETPAPADLLTIVDLAENGESVPVTVSAGDVPGNAAVREIVLLAEGNPFPQVAAFRFGPMAGPPTVSTRIRLTQSQTVIAAARLADGSVLVDRRAVEVTVGACASPAAPDAEAPEAETTQ